ncbi:hypothetical protein ACJD0Z_09665 [Flavobacteriaceae bacterium M23B6Z8]
MKKRKQIFDLNKKTVSALQKDVNQLKGGTRLIKTVIVSTDNPTAETRCFDCPVIVA